MKGVSVQVRVETETVNELIEAHLRERFPRESAFVIKPVVGRDASGNGSMFVKHYEVELVEKESDENKGGQ